jgi:hypothetical protein
MYNVSILMQLNISIYAFIFVFLMLQYDYFVSAVSFFFQMHIPLVTFIVHCAVIFQIGSATVQTYDIPRPLAQCFGTYKKKTSLANTPAVCIQAHCENMYMWQHAKDLNIQRGASPQAM